ncbi:MAG: reverse transcriptase domain-containing protein [bacterium]|nr:reverse transcriptase domain-containing protein [bacterium]
MARAQLDNTYEHIISLENLLDAWQEFVKGKRGRKDVQQFELRLMSNVLSLHNDLTARTYMHSPYEAFNISDPKPRNIHKASVRDRLLHHAIYRVLYPLFDKTFIAGSYSCRKGKGSHKAIDHFQSSAYQVSQNHTRTAWVLKCDIRKFFASIDQERLIAILGQRIPDKDILWLLSQIVHSFYTREEGIGLPLGNLTSQLLVNVYMNEFDQFVKQWLKVKHYVRYADDFVFLSHNREWLLELLPYIVVFLRERLTLELHPDKVSISTAAAGIDFLGWVHFPDHRTLRTSTKRRMLKVLRGNPKEEILASYRGMLSHGNAHKLSMLIPEHAADYGEMA